MKTSLIAIAMTLCAMALAAAPRETIELWPDGRMPHDDGIRYTEAEMQRDSTVNSPLLHLYPANEPSGLIVISCPGGGYSHLAINHEGHDFAGWYNRQGIHYAMLQYRMPRGNGEATLSDVRRAITLLRQRYPGSKIGLMGFSAGGHLVAAAATNFTDSVSRPDFQILFYPVTKLAPGDWMARQFCGENASAETVAKYSAEKAVTPTTPPAIIFHAADDPLVSPDHSTDYYRSLRRAGVSASLHIFPTGGHGWGFLDFYIYKPAWAMLLEEWLHTVPARLP